MWVKVVFIRFRILRNSLFKHWASPSVGGEHTRFIQMLLEDKERMWCFYNGNSKVDKMHKSFCEIQ